MSLMVPLFEVTESDEHLVASNVPTRPMFAFYESCSDNEVHAAVRVDCNVELFKMMTALVRL